MFITVDGPNGAGKTTACRALVAHLEQRGRVAVYMKEPTASDFGVYARDSEKRLRGWPLAALYVADRHMHVNNEIESALDAGAAVVCDRYIGATLVLQRLDGLDRGTPREMNGGLLVPDLSVILLAAPTLLHSRLAQRATLSRFEQLPDVAQREHDLYREAAEDLTTLGHRVAVIDATSMDVTGVLTAITTQLNI